MGVPGLWDILAPAGRSRSLAKLTIDAFESNLSGKRAYRVGIDASIWYKSMQLTVKEEKIRNCVYSSFVGAFICILIRLPLLPLFVFDGRWDRPKMKRGNRMGKSGIPDLTRNMKTLLDIFGIEWREARGEAEAKLAFLNSVGVIDAIMTDDVDAFLFGADTIIRNPSLSLTGNRSNPATNLDGKPSNQHVMEFRIEDIQTHPEIRKSRGGMILFALLTDNGIDKIGKATAHALVRCGFGDELYTAALNRDVESLHNFLPAWRERINTELRENRQGFLRRAAPGLCLPNSFPNLELLDKYVRPERNEGGIQGVWRNKVLNLPQLAAFCEGYFEWGTRTQIIKRFRSLLWDASVIYLLRKAALEQDKREVDRQYPPGALYAEIRHCRRPELRDAVGTSMSLISRYLKHDTTVRSDLDRRIRAAFINKGPMHSSSARESDDPRSFIIKIHGGRRHVSTDRSLEYRIEMDPEVLVQLANSGIKGTRPEQGQRTAPSNDVDDGTTEGSEDEGTATRKRKPKEPPNPLSTLRMWCPAPMIVRVNPGLIEEYDRVQEKKQKAMRKPSGSRGTASNRGRGRGKGRRRPRDSDNETETEAEDADSPRPSPQKRRRAIVRQDVSNNSSTVLPNNCNNSMPSDVFSDVISAPARPTGNFSRLEGRSHTASANSISISTTIASRPADTTSRDRANGSACRVSSTFQDVPAFSPQLRWTASHRPRISSDHWDANDSSSLFLFSIPDPCDPDLIEREDLRNRAPEPVFRWTNISSGVTHTYDRDEDKGFVSDDGELDRSFQLDFIRKAQQTNASYVLGGARKTAKPQVNGPDTLVIENPLSISTNKVGKKFSSFSQLTSSVSKTLRQRQTSSALDRNLPDYGRDIPLFLPSRLPSPVLVEQSSSQTTTHSTMSATEDSDVLSDEDFDFPSSSFDPPSSYLASSPAASQRQNERSYKKHQFANCSQDSGIAMCDDDDYLDLTHL